VVGRRAIGGREWGRSSRHYDALPGGGLTELAGAVARVSKLQCGVLKGLQVKRQGLVQARMGTAQRKVGS
jgi:hypothetical protein